MRVVSFLHFKVITKVPWGTAAEMMYALWVLRAHVILLGFFCAVSLLLPGFNLQRRTEHKRERDGIVATLGNLVVHKSESFWKYFGGQACGLSQRIMHYCVVNPETPPMFLFTLFTC